MKKLLIGIALIIVAVLCWHNLGLSFTTEQPQAETASRTGLTT